MVAFWFRFGLWFGCKRSFKAFRSFLLSSSRPKSIRLRWRWIWRTEYEIWIGFSGVHFNRRGFWVLIGDKVSSVPLRFWASKGCYLKASYHHFTTIQGFLAPSSFLELVRL